MLKSKWFHPFYQCRESLERVTTADQIQSLSQLAMEKFESEVWKAFGEKYVNKEDRRVVNLISISKCCRVIFFYAKTSVSLNHGGAFSLSTEDTQVDANRSMDYFQISIRGTLFFLMYTLSLLCFCCSMLIGIVGKHTSTTVMLNWMGVIGSR